MLRFALFPLSVLLNCLSVRAAYRLGAILGDFGFHVLRFRRRVVLSNLELAFGSSMTADEKRLIARDNYRHYGRLLLEIGRSLIWTRQDYLDQVVIEGDEHLARAVQQGKGAFLLSGHLGNWEIALSAGAAKGYPLDVVIKQARNRLAESVFRWYRQKTGAGFFYETGTARNILRALSKGRVTVFIFDQFMGPPIGLPVKFFGRQAGTVASLALLTDKRSFPILPTYSFRDEQGRLHVVVEPPIEFPRLSEDRRERLFQKTQHFNDVLERLVRKHPAQWLWLHRRWKAYRGEPAIASPAFQAPADALGAPV